MFLRQAGVGLNTMTLGGLAIAVGLLVDAAIIVTENIVHRLSSGGDARPVRRREPWTRRSRWAARSRSPR